MLRQAPGQALVLAPTRELAKQSEPIQRLVKASPDETESLTGSEDPGHQMDYSPVEGMLHKYEMGLLYVISTCSAHCRFCYREELISRKEVERHDGTVAKKGLAQIADVVGYVHEHNAAVDANGGRHPETGREKLREILLSGGDPMVLTNSKIAAWLGALAEAGVDIFHCSTRRFWEPEFEGSDLNLAGWTRKLTGKAAITVGSVGLNADFLPDDGTANFRAAEPASIDNLIERLEKDEFDLVAVGRALIANPDWANQVATGNFDSLAAYEKDMLQKLA